MSQWTHVNGSIRVDYLQIDESDDHLVKLIKSKFGNIANWEDDDKAWENCTVPCGSEGSLKYSVELTGDRSNLARIRVQVWGDLRDYGSDEECEKIVDWLNKSCVGLAVRNGVFEIEVGGQYRIALIRKGEKWEQVYKDSK